MSSFIAFNLPVLPVLLYLMFHLYLLLNVLYAVYFLSCLVKYFLMLFFKGAILIKFYYYYYYYQQKSVLQTVILCFAHALQHRHECKFVMLFFFMFVISLYLVRWPKQLFINTKQKIHVFLLLCKLYIKTTESHY